MKHSKKKLVVMGVCTIATGIWIGYLGLDSMRTGILVAVGRRGSSPLPGWIVLPMGGFLVFLGICVIGVAFGYVKLKGQE